MNDEEDGAFDDWEAEAEAVIEEVKNEPQQEAETNQQKAEEKEVNSKQVQEVVDPRTAFLNNLNFYKSLQGQTFEDYFEEAKSNSNTSVLKATNQILKNDKDFTQLAKAVGKRFNQQFNEEQGYNLDEDSLFGYWEELIYLIYEQSEWINLDNTKDKLKIVKKARKQDEVKAKKQKEKEQRQKKQQKLTQQQNSKKKPAKQPQQEVQQQDIFGGATFVNSKQKEDELKNKKVQAPKPSVQEDDDDFM